MHRHVRRKTHRGAWRVGKRWKEPVVQTEEGTAEVGVRRGEAAARHERVARRPPLCVEEPRVRRRRTAPVVL